MFYKQMRPRRTCQTLMTSELTSKLLCIPDYSRGKPEAISQTARAWLKLSHATRQSSEEHQIYTRMVEK